MTELAEATAALVAATGQLVTTKAQVTDWATGTATGGPNADGNYPFTAFDGTQIPVPSPALLKVTAKSARDYSTDLWSHISEPAERIQMALDAAFEDGKDVWIPRKETPYVFEHPGLYYPNEDGEWRRAMMRLRNGVSVRSNGAVLKLSEGRINPPGFFMQRYADDQRIDNVIFDGLIFDGGWRQLDPNIADLRQRYSFDNYAQKVDTSSGTPWDTSQMAHVISIWRGDNNLFRRCRFQNVLGYGVSLGQVSYAAIRPITYPRYHGVSNSHVIQSQLVNCYHGGVFMPAVWNGCSVQRSYFGGDGFYVGAIDLERHHTNDEVTDGWIDSNIFDFRGGYGPIAEGHDAKGNALPYDYGRTFLAQTRRAVALGWFFEASAELARGHKITRNHIYQGYLECFGHRDVTIHDNDITSFFEDLSEADEYEARVNLLSPHAIRFYANGKQTTQNEALTGCRVTENRIKGDIQGAGLFLYRYDDILESGNQIEGPRMAAVWRQATSGQSIGLIARNIGTEADPAPIYAIEGARGPITIAHPNVQDTRVTVVPGANPGDPPSAIIPHYGTASLVKMIGAVTQPVKVFGHTGFQSYVNGMFETTSENAGRLEQWGNGTGTFQTPNILLGDGTGPATAHFLGSEDGSLMLQFWLGTAAQPFTKTRLLIGSPGSDPYGWSMIAFRAAGTGSDQFFSYISATKEVRMVAGPVTLNGSYQSPLGFLNSNKKLWVDAQGSIRQRVVTADTPLANSFDGPALVEKVAVPTDPFSGVAPGHPGRSISNDVNWFYVWTGDGLFRKARLLDASTTNDPFVQKVAVPDSQNAPGTPGQYAAGGGFAYFCVATDTWQRCAIGGW